MEKIILFDTVFWKTLIYICISFFALQDKIFEKR